MLDPGDTVTVEVVAPMAGDHEYVEAPPALSVEEPPGQIALGVADTGVIVGVVLTVTATVADEAAGQPAADVPVTV